MEETDKVIIPQGKYSGYIWDSNKKQPLVLNQVMSDKLEFSASDNPFVVESQLYDVEKKISYSFKYVDGKYLFMKYDMDHLIGSFVTKQYIASFNNAPGLLVFRQYWREVLDEQCSMNTLRPKEFVFVGFKEEENKK